MEQFDPSYTRGNDDSRPFMKEMEEAGFEIILPADNELLIDLDTEEQYQTFLKQYERLQQDYSCTSRVYPSKSGLPRRHVVVELYFNMSPFQRIALQAALGSDPMRELLSFIRVMNSDPHPTLFVEKGDHQ